MTTGAEGVDSIGMEVFRRLAVRVGKGMVWVGDGFELEQRLNEHHVQRKLGGRNRDGYRTNRASDEILHHRYDR